MRQIRMTGFTLAVVVRYAQEGNYGSRGSFDSDLDEISWLCAFSSMTRF